jgi:phosphoribosyl 1,2-cyclic phosphodiesterase
VRVFVLGSGSTGNALLVDDGSTRILVEAGVGPRQVTERLALLGATLEGRRVDAIVATHEHGDHFGHAARLATELDATVWLHRGIGAPELRAQRDVETYEPSSAFRIGTIELSSVRVPHDAPQVALRLESKGLALGVATDVGRVTQPLVGLLASCDAALVEANYCSELLGYNTDYPPVVKRRLTGGLGHLSNFEAADLARRLSGTRLGRIWIGHLSRANNTPERALDVVGSAAKRIEVEALPHGAICALDVRCSRPHQLALCFDGRTGHEAAHDTPPPSVRSS